MQSLEEIKRSKKVRFYTRCKSANTLGHPEYSDNLKSDEIWEYQPRDCHSKILYLLTLLFIMTIFNRLIFIFPLSSNLHVPEIWLIDCRLFISALLIAINQIEIDEQMGEWMNELTNFNIQQATILKIKGKIAWQFHQIIMHHPTLPLSCHANVYAHLSYAIIQQLPKNHWQINQSVSQSVDLFLFYSSIHSKYISVSGVLVKIWLDDDFEIKSKSKISIYTRRRRLK